MTNSKSFEIESDIKESPIIASYLRALPIPAKHFIIYSLIEGLVWPSLKPIEISKLLQIDESEVIRIYEEAQNMLAILNVGQNSYPSQKKQ